ncbi:MAG TPA: response regulator [Candidatus Acidoferrum sp.]|nr:response regulator [Candidatus Acidoferrum sp.]
MAITRTRSKPFVVSIVDDDEAIRYALGNLFESVGLNVETFASAEQFMDFREANESSCLILDVQLPRMSGLELQHQLSSDGNAVPIIFMTAHSDERVRERALQAGAVAIFQKPFNSEALLNAIHSVLK